MSTRQGRGAKRSTGPRSSPPTSLRPLRASAPTPANSNPAPWCAIMRKRTSRSGQIEMKWYLFSPRLSATHQPTTSHDERSFLRSSPACGVPSLSVYPAWRPQLSGLETQDGEGVGAAEGRVYVMEPTLRVNDPKPERPFHKRAFRGAQTPPTCRVRPAEWTVDRGACATQPGEA